MSQRKCLRGLIVLRIHENDRRELVAKGEAAELVDGERMVGIASDDTVAKYRDSGFARSSREASQLLGPGSRLSSEILTYAEDAPHVRGQGRGIGVRAEIRQGWSLRRRSGEIEVAEWNMEMGD